MALGGMAAAMLCLLASSGILPINTNDGSNFLLQALYAGQGLEPYKDYGFVYPPGIALLFGKFLGLTQGGMFLRTVWLAGFLLIAINMFLVTTLNTKPFRFFISGLMGLVSSLFVTILFYTHGTEPFTTLLLLTLLLLSVQNLSSPSRQRLVAIFLCGFCITLIRWDRAIAVAGIDFAATLLLGGLAWKKASRSPLPRNMMNVTLSLCAGIIAAMGFMALYALGTNSWDETVWFLFGVPQHIMPYRGLPLPSFNIFDPSALFYTSLAATAVLSGAGFSMFKSAKPARPTAFAECLFLIAAPIAMLPYALGRSDYAHFMPVAGMAAGALLIGSVLWSGIKIRIILLAMLVISFVPLTDSIRDLSPWLTARNSKGFLWLQESSFKKNMEITTQECTHLIPPEARSLFVGRSSYAHFIDSPMILYAAVPALRPATLYIAEDPGIQNACDYGARIAQQLDRAPRPMVAFLSTSPQWREPNATETMTSCNRIEKYLADSSPAPLGTCRIGPDLMKAVIYRW